MARSKRCLSCKYCRILRTDKTERRNIASNYTCDYMIITGKKGNKGDDTNNCLLYEKREGGGYDTGRKK